MAYMKDSSGRRLDSFEVLSEVDAAATYSSPADPTTGKAMQSAAGGTARTVAVTGHSLAYGQDESGSGTNPPINGASQTRSATTPTATLANQSAFTAVGGAVSIVNQSYPGDRSSEALTRWVGGSSGNIEFFWIDTNDAMNYGGFGSGTLSDAQTASNLRDLIKRARSRGSDVVVMGGAPVLDVPSSRKIFASAQADRVIAERMGARFVDVGELLASMPISKATWTDNVHLSTFAYGVVGGRIAGLLGPKGVNPPAAHPGRMFTPRQSVFVGGTVQVRANSTSGRTLSITGTSTVALSVEVHQPVVPIIKCYVESGVGAGVVGIYANANASGHPTKYAKVSSSSSASGIVYLRGTPMLSPGPDAVVIRAETGTIEIDSIEFVPFVRGRDSIAVMSMEYTPIITGALHPVGGAGARGATDWDSMIDPQSGTAITTGAAGTTNVKTRWVFELALGVANSGVLLAHAVRGGIGYGMNTGYMFLRNGADLIIREWNETATDQTVTSVFAATGIARHILEITHDDVSGQITVRVDGVVKGSSFTPTWKQFCVGLIAGATSGPGYASGTYVVCRTASGETV
jgi:hypothetical protein